MVEQLAPQDLVVASDAEALVEVATDLEERWQDVAGLALGPGCQSLQPPRHLAGKARHGYHHGSPSSTAEPIGTGVVRSHRLPELCVVSDRP